LSDTVILIDKRVLTDDEAIFFVTRSAKGHWSFHPQDHLDNPDAQLVQSTFSLVADHDPEILEIADLPPGWQAWRDPDTGALSQRCESPTGPTFLVEFEARPTDLHPDRTEHRGAFVNCYTRCTSLEVARQTARAELESEHWEIVDEGDSCEIYLESYEEEDEGRNYFRQAQIDGLVCVFHTYLLE
jgi:hypothetical protein